MTNIFKKKYTINENFIQFNINDNTVKKVIDFYSEAPFPNYENNDDKSSINFKLNLGSFSLLYPSALDSTIFIFDRNCTLGSKSRYSYKYASIYLKLL